MVNLSVDEKIKKAIVLSSQGVSRQAIADELYNSKDNKSRLRSLRELMRNNGYRWDENSHSYISVDTNKQEQTKINKNNEGTNKQEETKTNKGLSDEDIAMLNEILVLYRSNQISMAETTATTQTTELVDFKGVLKSTTLQLYKGVWDLLDEYAHKSKLSKKTIVNNAIWDYINKQK